MALCNTSQYRWWEISQGNYNYGSILIWIFLSGRSGQSLVCLVWPGPLSSRASECEDDISDMWQCFYLSRPIFVTLPVSTVSIVILGWGHTVSCEESHGLQDWVGHVLLRVHVINPTRVRGLTHNTTFYFVPNFFYGQFSQPRFLLPNLRVVPLLL